MCFLLRSRINDPLIYYDIMRTPSVLVKVSNTMIEKLKFGHLDVIIEYLTRIHSAE